MTKSELIAGLAADNPHLRGADLETIVSTIFSEITAALARGSRVELRGFGAFTVKHRDARTGRNPRTGEAVPVEEKAVPFFKAGKELRERVNAGKAVGAGKAGGAGKEGAAGKEGTAGKEGGPSKVGAAGKTGAVRSERKIGSKA